MDYASIELRAKADELEIIGNELLDRAKELREEADRLQDDFSLEAQSLYLL